MKLVFAVPVFASRGNPNIGTVLGGFPASATIPQAGDYQTWSSHMGDRHPRVMVYNIFPRAPSLYIIDYVVVRLCSSFHDNNSIRI